MINFLFGLSVGGILMRLWCIYRYDRHLRKMRKHNKSVRTYYATRMHEISKQAEKRMLARDVEQLVKQNAR